MCMELSSNRRPVEKMMPQKLQSMSQPQTQLQNCDDCGRLSQLCTVSACPEFHTFGTSCCTKNVCVDFCQHICSCGVTNYLSREDLEHLENYIEGFICFSCGLQNTVRCQFWGDLRENCRRYCGAVTEDKCISSYSFIVYGRAATIVTI